MTEIIPTNIRGRLMILLGLSFSIGQLFGVYLTSIILDKDLDSGNWRLLNFISAFPLFISVLI
jgi:MFS family permease